MKRLVILKLGTLLSVSAFALCFTGATVLSAPGDVLDSITTPVASPSGIGTGIAADCEDPATLFYTHTSSALLHKMDKDGNVIGAPIPLTDQATGNPITFGAISWDQTRQKLWGGTDSTFPVEAWLIDPNSGVATHVFTMMTSSSFSDGIAFDGSDNSLWISGDAVCTLDHWDVSGVDANGVGAANFIAALTPKAANGTDLCVISGLAVGKGDILYLGRNGLGKITRVNKDGTFDSEFSAVGGRNEGLACDLVSYAPLEVLWSKSLSQKQS